MSQRVQDNYTDTDFRILLEGARGNAKDAWEEEFLDDIHVKFEKYGTEMFLSEKQEEKLKAIANR